MQTYLLIGGCGTVAFMALWVYQNYKRAAAYSELRRKLETELPKAVESLERMKEAARAMGVKIDETENTQ